MTPINIAIPESLTTQKAELETILGGIAGEEEKLAAQRKDIQVALQSITAAVAVLSGQPLPASKVASPTGRKPMSVEARQRIAEGLRRSAQAKALAKAAQGATPALPSSAQEPADVPVEAPAPEMPAAQAPGDTPVVAPAPEEPVEAPADATVPDSPREARASRKTGKR